MENWSHCALCHCALSQWTQFDKVNSDLQEGVFKYFNALAWQQPTHFVLSKGDVYFQHLAPVVMRFWSVHNHVRYLKLQLASGHFEGSNSKKFLRSCQRS